MFSLWHCAYPRMAVASYVLLLFEHSNELFIFYEVVSLRKGEGVSMAFDA